MPSLRILYDVDGWVSPHQARALERHAPADFPVSIAPLDGPGGPGSALGTAPVDLACCPPPTRLARVRAALDRRDWPTRLVAGWRAGRPPGTRCIPSGVDPDVVRVRVPLEGRARDKRAPAAMADSYDGGTVLVVASESEGTPDRPEATACGWTVLSTRVGNMSERIGAGASGRLVERDPESLLRGVEWTGTRCAELARRMQRDIRAWEWRPRIPAVFGVFREVLAGPGRLAPAPAGAWG